MAEDKERFRRALDFMKVLGVSNAVVAPLLRRLVKLYDNEWSLIEEENYRVLADSYFDQVESKEAKAPLRVTRNSSRRCAASNEIRETEVHFKETHSVHTKTNRRVTFSPASTIENDSLNHMEDEEKKAQVENDYSKHAAPKQEKAYSRPYELQVECVSYKETLPNDLAHMERGIFKKPRIEAAASPPMVRKLAPDMVMGLHSPKMPSKVKEEPLELPLVMKKRDEIVKKHVAPQPYPIPAAIMSTRQQERQIVVYNKDDESRSRSDDSESKGSLLREKPKKSSALITYTENKGSKQKNESLLKIADTYGDTSDDESAVSMQNGNMQWSKKPPCMKKMCTNDKGKGSTSSSSLILRAKETQGLRLRSSAAVKEEPAGTPDLHHDTYCHNCDDISRGQESVPISLSNELTNERLPPSFCYIKNNITFQDAYVNFALARIGEEGCCAKCSIDCLKKYPPCHCAGESGGEFAYDLKGCLHRRLLDEAIADRQSSSTRNKFCEKGSCLLVQGKNGENSEQCKGHLIRKFVKECWSKCGCDMQCGNRVVQRGIRQRLQVFYVSKGKGWGLRTLEDLPLGTFICEYVGEILTNVELHERNISRKGHTNHYPALLDADLSSETILKDEDLLCLDATNYGNVARFINHRCYDANMVDIPVEIESPDHHYYHIAFFTTRPVQAGEELTWDYCMDFEDVMHPIKAFRCLCGSEHCRGHHYRAR